MAQNLARLLQDEIKDFMATMLFFQSESLDLYNLYWKGDVSSTISALAGTDPVTLSTELTKNELINGVTFCEELDDFYTNSGVTTGDYNSTCQNIIYGDVTTPTKRSNATEDMGERLKNLCTNAISKDSQAMLIVDLYNDNEFSDIVSVLDNQRIITGSDMTKDDLNLAITLITQYRNMIGNSAVTTGDYASTVSKWRRL